VVGQHRNARARLLRRERGAEGGIARANHNDIEFLHRPPFPHGVRIERDRASQWRPHLDPEAALAPLPGGDIPPRQPQMAAATPHA
jgi:hypothetical protein